MEIYVSPADSTPAVVNNMEVFQVTKADKKADNGGLDLL